MQVKEIVFSPTGGTKKAADMLSAALGETTEAIDLVSPRFAPSKAVFQASDTVIIAVPSYGGRAPKTAIERLTKLNGGGARAILLCVYGNRAYEDTLAELQDTAVGCGFSVQAAVTAVAEHSIVRDIAAKRPDSDDEARLAGFGAHIAEKLNSGLYTVPQLPGNRPYKEAGSAKMVPKAGKACIGCGICAQKCPVQAIDPCHPRKTDASRCISCMRCIAVCPRSARRLNPVMLCVVQTMLKKVCAVRRECELFV